MQGFHLPCLTLAWNSGKCSIWIIHSSFGCSVQPFFQGKMERSPGLHPLLQDFSLHSWSWRSQCLDKNANRRPTHLHTDINWNFKCTCNSINLALAKELKLNPYLIKIKSYISRLWGTIIHHYIINIYIYVTVNK